MSKREKREYHSRSNGIFFEIERTLVKKKSRFQEIEVIEKEERNEQSGIITYRQIVRNQRGEEVVVGIMKTLMTREKRRKKD